MINRSGVIRTLAVFSDILDTACLRLRILAPAQQLGWQVLRGITEEGFDARIVEQADVVVIQRDHCRIMRNYERVISLAHQRGIPVIFDLDDLLFELPEDHPDRLNASFADALLPMLLAVIEADLVTVTTDQLRDYLLPYNQNTLVLPNYLDDSTWQMKTPGVGRVETASLVIGYMGTDSHEPDLQEVLPALVQVARKYPGKVAFRFWGIQPPQELIQLTKVEWNPHPTFTYMDFVQYFQGQSADIVIAPLRDNLFNACKSPLKFFEYSASGIPGVYSRVAAYEGVITDGQEGLLASTTQEWVDALSALIVSSDLRERVITRAQAAIRDRWLLSSHTDLFRTIYEEAIHGVEQSQNTRSHIIPLLSRIAEQSDGLLRDTRNKLVYVEHLLEEKDLFLHSLRYENHLVKQQLDAVRSELLFYAEGSSWKITRPIRQFRRKLRKGG